MPTRILLATDRRFWRGDSGSCARIAALCEHLSERGHDLNVFFTEHIGPDDMAAIRAGFPRIAVHHPDTAELQATSVFGDFARRLGGGIKQLIRMAARGPDRAVPRHGGRKPDGRWKTKDPASPPQSSVQGRRLADFVSPPARHAFARLFKRLRPEIVLVEYVRLGYLVHGLPRRGGRRALLAVDTLDVMSERCRRFQEAGESHWLHVTCDEEGEVLKRFGIVIAIQQADAKRLEALAPGSTVVTVPHGMRVQAHPEPVEGPVRLLYVATGTRENLLAIEAFLEEVWPALRDRFGERVRLLLAGHICERLRERTLDKRVSLEGYVEDIGALYARTHIVINPVRLGAGLKIKNVEALCHGKPLVTTAIGAEGIEGHGRGALVVCETSRAMVEALSQLIATPSLRAALSREALRLAEETFSPERAYAALDAVFEQAR